MSRDASCFSGSREIDAGDPYHGDTDPQFAGGGYDDDEAREERWLDQNATPVLINRYNGTLIRGE